MKKILPLLLIIYILFSGCTKKEDNNVYQIPNLATDSELYAKEVNMKEYYLFACDLCNFLKEQFDILIENYPERYKVLQPKLNEYVSEMTIIENDADEEELYIKGNYALTYGEELVSLVREKGLDEFVPKDYQELIDKGIVKE